MAVKIKWNDDRVKSAAVAVLLICRAQLSQGSAEDGLVQSALQWFRNYPEDYKAQNPQRDLAATRDLSSLTDKRRRDVYEKLLAAVEALLGRVERNRTQFSSLLEVDNFLVANLEVSG
jgi:hypothetical protein